MNGIGSKCRRPRMTELFHFSCRLRAPLASVLLLKYHRGRKKLRENGVERPPGETVYGGTTPERMRGRGEVVTRDQSYLDAP